MRGMLCLLVLGTVAMAAPLQDKPRPELGALVAAERAFAKMSVDQGLQAAFLANLAEDAVLFRPRIVNGRKFYREMPATTAVLEWEPAFADLAADADLGYTTGPWSLRTKPGEPPSRFGHYVSLWQRQPDSSVKVVIDVGITHPALEKPPVLTLAPPAAPPSEEEAQRQRDRFFTLEKDFENDDAKPRNMLDTYRGHLAARARVYREGQPPQEGAAALKLLDATTNPAASWRAEGMRLSHGADLGFAYGTVLAPDGTATASYLRIWRWQFDAWKIVLDLENKLASQQKPPSTLALRARHRVSSGNSLAVQEKQLAWEPSQTALLVCDVWDKHWCPSAVTRVNEMVPRMNKVVEEARKKGVLIIHAPSECMKFYDGTPQRKLAQSAPKASNLPRDIAKWCSSLPNEPKLPIDDSDNGCDCDPAPKPHQAWTRQHEVIRIADGDAVSDSGVEIWNLLQQRGIRNVMVLGVHTNMCVLGRPFGLRQLSKNGMNVVLVRDLTDAMYNPKMPPHVSHAKGTELVIEHIEQHVCGSVHSGDILGEPQQPHVVFIIGENEYQTEKTLPYFAKRELEPLRLRCTFVHANPKNPNEFPGLDAIKTADLVVLSVRRRSLPKEQLALIRQYLEAGKPLVGIRTASHAFDPRPPGQGASWPTFDVEVLGAKYLGHYGGTPPPGTATVIHVEAKHAQHPILSGFQAEPFRAASHLYKNRELAPTATPLLHGTITQESVREPVAWTNTYKGGRIFYTSLGSPGDFELPVFRRLLKNGILWALDRPIAP